MKNNKILKFVLLISIIFSCQSSSAGENIYYGMSFDAFKESLKLPVFKIKTPFEVDVKVIDSPEWNLIQKDLFGKFKFWCSVNGNLFNDFQQGYQAGMCESAANSDFKYVSFSAIDFKNKDYSENRHLIVFHDGEKSQKEIYGFFQAESLRLLRADRGETNKYRKLSKDSEPIAAKGDVVCAVPNSFKVHYAPNESHTLGVDRVFQSQFGYIAAKGVLNSVDIYSFTIKIESIGFVGESIVGDIYSTDLGGRSFSVRNDFGNLNFKVGALFRDVKSNWYPCGG